MPQIVAFVNSIVTPLQEAKQFANTITQSGQMAITEYGLCNFAKAVEQFEQFYIKEALALTHVMQKELIKIAKNVALLHGVGITVCLIIGVWSLPLKPY